MKLSLSHPVPDHVDIVLLSSGPLSALASAQLARLYDMPLAMAQGLLSKGRGLVAGQMPREKAKVATALMATFGVRLAMVPVGHDALPELFDLCLHLTELPAAALVEAMLRDLGLWVLPEPPDFLGLGGLQLQDLTYDVAQASVLALDRIAGVEVMSCGQNHALYDLFLAPDQKRADLMSQIKYLADMGCYAAHPWPAMAVGLDRQMLTHFKTRFTNHGLVCVNQAFQRYNLILTGLGEVSIRDFVDFLTVRGHAPSVAFDGLRHDKGLTIEKALSRKSAEQFLADYTMIGLKVRADFVRL